MKTCAASNCVVMAQTLGLPIGVEMRAGRAAARAAAVVPATRWELGLAAGGFVVRAGAAACSDAEVPEFEIDAQPVTWSQYVEFVDDGGYDRPRALAARGPGLAGAAAQEGRRGPRHVEQIGAARHGTGGSVLQQRFGRTVRAAGHRSAVHVAGGRPMPGRAGPAAASPPRSNGRSPPTPRRRRGFRWADVHEWTAGTLRPWPGFRADPWSQGSAFDPVPAFGQARVLRGASFATRARLRSPKRRGFALPERDDGFFGFRTCALWRGPALPVPRPA